MIQIFTLGFTMSTTSRSFFKHFFWKCCSVIWFASEAECFACLCIFGSLWRRAWPAPHRRSAVLCLGAQARSTAALRRSRSPRRHGHRWEEKELLSDLHGKSVERKNEENRKQDKKVLLQLFLMLNLKVLKLQSFGYDTNTDLERWASPFQHSFTWVKDDSANLYLIQHTARRSRTGAVFRFSWNCSFSCAAGLCDCIPWRVSSAAVWITPEFHSRERALI